MPEEKPAKPKSRCTYSKEMRAEASLAMKGLVTVSVKMLDGTLVEFQGPANLDEQQAVKWFAVLLGRPELRPLPNAEDSIREICEAQGVQA